MSQGPESPFMDIFLYFFSSVGYLLANMCVSLSAGACVCLRPLLPAKMLVSCLFYLLPLAQASCSRPVESVSYSRMLCVMGKV